MSGMYNRTNPYVASVKERYCLTQPGSKKNTQHIVLDLKGSGIMYSVGDSVAIFPTNDTSLVKSILDAINATGRELIVDKRSGEEIVLWDFFEKKASISDVSRKLITTFSERQTNSQKKSHLQAVLEAKEVLKEYQSHHEVRDALLANPEVVFTPQELCDHLQPLLPRFYSIASSMETVGEEIHLTVALLKYQAGGTERVGVCTHYLCNSAQIGETPIPMYIQPHNGFTIPEDPNTPIIMVGPGTGIAPFRAFMQERERMNAKRNWLFFGEWNRAHDFFYEDYWVNLQKQGCLKIETAFSRDQQEKIYVQHRMLEQGAELYQWLCEGARLYVCGDAQRMAKDVDASLHRIVETHGKMSPEEAQEYVKGLRKEKRYLRDVY